MTNEVDCASHTNKCNLQSSKKGSSVHTQSNHPVAVAANKSTTFQGAEWFHKNVIKVRKT